MAGTPLLSHDSIVTRTPVRQFALPTSAAAESQRVLCLLWAVSGFCTLCMETMWIRRVSLWAGNTVVASTLVIAVFFAAAAAGNWWGGRLVARVERPLRCFGLFEMAAGLAAGATYLASLGVWRHAGVWPGAWSAQCVAALLLVGPPAFCAGVAFPSLAEAYIPNADERTARGAPFYGWNLLGAAAGVSAGGVWLPLELGFGWSFGVVALLEITVGFLAWRMVRKVGAPRPRSAPAEETGARQSWPGALLLVGSGALSLAAQALALVWARQLLDGSIYTICGVLTAFLGGLGLGALAVAAARRRGYAAATLLRVFAGLSAVFLFLGPALAARLFSPEPPLDAGTTCGLLAQAVSRCALVLGPLAFALGGVSPLFWEMALARTAHQGRALGMALAFNKLGAAAGMAGGLFLLLPALGLAGSTLALGWAYAALSAGGLRGRRLGWLGLVALVGILESAQTYPLLGLTPQSHLIASYTGAYGPVAVVDDRDTGSRQILLNSRQRLSGTRRALPAQRHQSWAPLLFCARPERVATIGMAAGLSADAALDFPIRELYAIELVPEVTQAAREHFGEWDRRLFSDPRAHVLTGDGRVALALLPGRFDAIVCDLLFPSDDSTAQLYSLDFFREARARLEPGGVFCVWLPCYQHTAESAGLVISTFLQAFPHALAIRAGFDPQQPILGLLGSNDPIPLGYDYLGARLQTPELHALAAQSSFFQSPENALLLLIGDLRTADPPFAQNAINTDDHPLFAWLGPRRPQGRERLWGFPFLEWIGRRFLKPEYPSLNLGQTPPAEILGAIRAGNFYYAAAAAQEIIPGDPRPAEVRQQQVAGYLQRARELSPCAHLPPEALGQ